MSMTVGSNESRSYSEINMTSCTKSWRKRWQICSIAAWWKLGSSTTDCV